MKRILLVQIFSLVILIPSVLGQSVSLDKLVTFSYTNVRLGDALQDISNSHNVRFTYSRYYVPVDKKINVRVVQSPLTAALDLIFENTQVEYAVVGDQILLKKGKRKSLETSPTFGSNDFPRRAMEQDETLTASNRIELKELSPLESSNFNWTEVVSEQTVPEASFDPDEFYVPFEASEEDYSFHAQVTIVPNMGTNMEYANDRTNRFSLNVFGGENGGVDGVEVGGLFNKVSNDVNGVQIAGLFNSVGGDVGPALFSTGAARDRSFGVQVAGLVNSADDAHAVQVGGLVNRDRGMFIGVQVAGLWNTVGMDAEGVQLAGLFNANGGDATVQVAGLVNVADDVQGGQVGGLFNRAENVSGLQVGLINVCDSITGPTVGLLNFVKKGYNQFEIGASETMQTQLSLRFGSYRFYNILQFGVQYINQIDYSYGYGIGVNLPMRKPNWQWNLEALGSYVDERGVFRSSRLMGQFRMTAEYTLGKKCSLFLGPTANILTAKLTKEELEAGVESEVPMYTLFDNLNDGNNPRDVKIWFGFRAGLRFGRNHQ